MAEGKPEDNVLRPASSAGANAAIIIAVIATAVAIYLLQALLAPFVFAVFLLIVIGGLSRVLRRFAPGLPRSIAMGIAVIVILAAFAAVAWIAFDNVSRLLADSETYSQRLNETVLSLQREFGVEVPSRIEALTGRPDLSRLAGPVAGWLQASISSTGFMLIYLGFMMASGQAFKRKMLAITGARAGLEETQAIFERIREGVTSYIWVQTATGFLIAVVSWGVLALFGVPSPIFWAFVIFVTSYVPIVGGIVGVFLPVIFFLAVEGGLSEALLLLAALQTIQLLIGNVLQPRMQSETLNVDAIVVLLSLGLWGVLLGPVGAFLSTPITVTAMVILAQFPRTRWMAILLSANARAPAPGAGAADKTA
jgi:AI-2 transport protein TqsA